MGPVYSSTLLEYLAAGAWTGPCYPFPCLFRGINVKGGIRLGTVGQPLQNLYGIRAHARRFMEISLSPKLDSASKTLDDCDVCSRHLSSTSRVGTSSYLWHSIINLLSNYYSTFYRRGLKLLPGSRAREQAGKKASFYYSISRRMKWT
jgi:hypothetical protein